MAHRKQNPKSMIRVYFVFDCPDDDAGINLSYVDIPTSDPGAAFQRVEEAAESGELWENLYPDEEQLPYQLIPDKMFYLDITKLPSEQQRATTLPL